MKKCFYLLFVFLFGIVALLSGCQKSNELEKVDILVTVTKETIDKNDDSVAVSFTVNNNSDEYIVVSYFDEIYGEEYLTVDESPYSIIPPQTTNPDFGYGYEYSSEKEYLDIIPLVNKEYHFRAYLCEKDYLNSDNPIHKDEYRDITVSYNDFK